MCLRAWWLGHSHVLLNGHRNIAEGQDACVCLIDWPAHVLGYVCVCLQTVEMLMGLVKRKYRIGHIGDTSKHGDNAWDEPIAPMEEVTMGNLIYDRHDIDLFEV